LNRLGVLVQKPAKTGDRPRFLFCAVNGRAVAVFGISDRPRENAPGALAQLHRMGVRTLLVTGDVRAAANYVAGRVGIDEHVGVKS